MGTLRSRTRRGYAAFSLLGLLIVVAIMMFLFVGGGNPAPTAAPAAAPAGGSGAVTSSGGTAPAPGGGYVRAAIRTKRLAQSTAIQSNINQICIMMSAYRLSHDGKLPKELSELEAPEQIYNDEWGTPMTFRYGEAEQGKQISEIIFHSAGKDELMGTRDDVIWKGKLQD